MAGDGAGTRASSHVVLHDVLDDACHRLQRMAPARSAFRTLTLGQWVWAIVGLAGLAAAVAHAPALTLAIVAICGKFLFVCAIGFRLVAAAASLSPAPKPAARWTGPLPIYTILCPLRGEARVIGDLVAALDALDYPKDKLDIKLVLEADDDSTLWAALALDLPSHIEIIVTTAAEPRTKPKALNYAFSFAAGGFVAVYDAEDRPHPQQLRAALDAFAAGGPQMAVAQAPLLVDNARASWIAGQFAAEYAIQFREVLPLLARLGLPLPLGGTSNHFRAEALRAAGGWDPFNVTEDADLGYRLARDGWTSAMIEPPTWEEAPVNLRAWTLQRARWIKGHMQTWLVLMRAPFRTMREMGGAAFASMQVLLLGGVLAAFMHLPLAAIFAVSVFTPLKLLGPPDIALAVAGYATAIYGALAAAALLRDGRLARAALTMPFYWPLHSIAAVRALGSLIVRPHHWRKTAHGVSARPILARA